MKWILFLRVTVLSSPAAEYIRGMAKRSHCKMTERLDLADMDYV